VQIQTTMLFFGMIPVGGKSPAYQCTTVMSTKDEISGEDLGLARPRKSVHTWPKWRRGWRPKAKTFKETEHL
jgi:hypothetical protein